MEVFREAVLQMIQASKDELEVFLGLCYPKTFSKNEVILQPGSIPQEVYFIKSGLIRVIVTDPDGNEHTIHFAMEQQFITDYSSFIMKQPALYSMQALETTEVVVLPRKAIEWGYKNLHEGEKMGRLVAEFYFIYQDNRIKNIYARSPKERYEAITDVFPNIHQRVPQHMIASYLGISPVHLSRLKKSGS
jgi:CRP-like cAMP-binding protein